MKIAVLGGSFDPVHAGHLQIAKEALKMGMDEVWLMPTHDTPLKSRALSEDAHRVAMLKRAAAPYRRIRVCTMELERPGVSYTVDTARALIARYPDDTFFWLIGSDQALQLPRWKDIDELLQLVQIVVFSREDTSVPRSPYPLIYRPMQLVLISSTQLREGERLALSASGGEGLHQRAPPVSGELREGTYVIAALCAQRAGGAAQRAAGARASSR